MNINIVETLEGKNDFKGLVSLEVTSENNKAYLFVRENGKKSIKEMTYQPFLFMADMKKMGVTLYQNDAQRKKRAMEKHSIRIETLKTLNIPRLEEGYPFIVKSLHSFKAIQSFFKEGGVDIYSEKYKKFFLIPRKQDMFMMEHGIRMFKGMDFYKDLHKFYFDIETTGLNPETSRTVLIGYKDNRDKYELLHGDENGPCQTEDERESKLILSFFKKMDEINPDVIAGYYSENFDFPFLIKRSEILGIDINSCFTKLPGLSSYKTMLSRIPSTIKLGADLEEYEKTNIYGKVVLDICHFVRKAMAIDTSIKAWKLKYIASTLETHKKDRTYIDGDKIFETFSKNFSYLTHKETNKYILFSESVQENNELEVPNNLKEWITQHIDFIIECKPSFLPEEKIEGFRKFVSEIDSIDEKALERVLSALRKEFVLLSGKQIVKQYLYDDLYETEQVDSVYGQSSFYMCKNLPTDFARTCTMGNAAMWKLIMFSSQVIENKIAIPKFGEKRKIVGGLNRLLVKGYNENVVKVDYDGLYPNQQLGYEMFPNVDILNVLKESQIYFGKIRKFHKTEMKKAKEALDYEKAVYHEYVQLPFKILRNSQYGSVSSPAQFPWGDSMIGERITSTGRQQLRRMAKFFHDKGCVPLVMNTDGCNFAVPEGFDFESELAQFNEQLAKDSKGYMKVDNDGVYKATINLSKNCYANLAIRKDGTYDIKLVGGALINKKIEDYAKKVIDKGITLLLENKGREFVDLYNKTITDLFYGKIVTKTIVSKSKMKDSIENYIEKLKGKNINGTKLPRQTHMELLIKEGKTANLGDNIYFINTGTAKSHSDVEHGILVSDKELENPDYNVNYNKAKYIDKFNERIKPLLCVFKKEVSEKLIVKSPENIVQFTKEDLLLVSNPVEFKHKEKYVEVDEEGFEMNEESNLSAIFEMTYPEMKFWYNSLLDPNEIFSFYEYENKATEILSKIVNWNNKKFEQLKLKIEAQGFTLKRSHEKFEVDDYIVSGTFDKGILLQRYLSTGFETVIDKREQNIVYTGKEKRYAAYEEWNLLIEEIENTKFCIDNSLIFDNINLIDHLNLLDIEKINLEGKIDEIYQESKKVKKNNSEV